MTSQKSNDIIQSSNNNVIKIPYSDNQEESIKETSMNVNGFNIIELDEEKDNLSNLISLYEGEQDIESKEQILLKLKAKTIENYYADCQDTIVPNINCSRCFLGNFSPNELLYFKDRKIFIAYMKYCFINYKRSLFMNHSTYMNNKYDLFKINQSFYNGWKFSIPKAICKSCFLQIINMEYLIFNIKNIICDYNSGGNSMLPSEKKISNAGNTKKKRIILKNKRINQEKTKENTNIDDEKTNDNNTKINPIVIPISKKEKNINNKKKRRRSSISFFRKRRPKNPRKKKESKYNKNIIYDSNNNILIIKKEDLVNFQMEEEGSNIINSSINDKKKDKSNIDKENSRQKKKKEEKLKFVSNLKTESNSLTNKKTNLKENTLENSNKDIDGNKNKNICLNKSNDLKSTIIINNINNSRGQINMDKVGLIQLNNNQNNFVNCSNKGYNNTKIKLNENYNGILINDLAPIYFNYVNCSNISFVEGLKNSMNELFYFLNRMCYFTADIPLVLLNNPIYIIMYKTQINFLFQNLKTIINNFNQAEAVIEYSINTTKNNIIIYQKVFGIDNYIWKSLNDSIKTIEEQEIEIKKKYNDMIQFCFDSFFILSNVIDNIA